MTTGCSCVVIDMLKMFALFAAKTKYNVLEIDKYLKGHILQYNFLLVTHLRSASLILDTQTIRLSNV